MVSAIWNEALHYGVVPQPNRCAVIPTEGMHAAVFPPVVLGQRAGLLATSARRNRGITLATTAASSTGGIKGMRDHRELG